MKNLGKQMVIMVLTVALIFSSFGGAFAGDNSHPSFKDHFNGPAGTGVGVAVAVLAIGTVARIIGLPMVAPTGYAQYHYPVTRRSYQPMCNIQVPRDQRVCDRWGCWTETIWSPPQSIPCEELGRYSEYRFANY